MNVSDLQGNPPYNECVCVFALAQECVCWYVCVCACMHVSVCMRSHVCMHAFEFVSLCVCVVCLAQAERRLSAVCLQSLSPTCVFSVVVVCVWGSQ